jgi:hypothetical protein
MERRLMEAVIPALRTRIKTAPGEGHYTGAPLAVMRFTLDGAKILFIGHHPPMVEKKRSTEPAYADITYFDEHKKGQPGEALYLSQQELGTARSVAALSRES